MINYKKFITADPMALAKILCYMNGYCAGCPVYQGDRMRSREFCIRELYSWLMGVEDEAYWEGMEHEQA